jgi:hypothetical protein
MEPELVAGNPALDPLGPDLLDLDHRGQDLRLDQHRRRVEGQTSDIPDHQFLLDQAVWPGDEKANLGLHQQETNVIEDWVGKALFHLERAPGHHPQPETTNGVGEGSLFHRGQGQPLGPHQPETKGFEEALFHRQPPGLHHQQETEEVREDLFHRPRAPGLHQDRDHGHD